MIFRCSPVIIMFYLLMTASVSAETLEYASPAEKDAEAPPLVVKAIAAAIGTYAGDPEYEKKIDTSGDKSDKKDDKNKDKTDKKDKKEEPKKKKEVPGRKSAKKIISDDDDDDDDDDADDSDEVSAGDLRKNAAESIAKMKIRHVENIGNWRSEYAETLKAWEKEHQAFLDRIPIYKSNLAKIPAVKPVPIPINPDKKEVLVKPSPFHMVKGAWDVPIKDQGGRGTCASFAGIRAIEIMLKQQGRAATLSEQYFYWASRPDCQLQPCIQAGSWAAVGYEFSKRTAGIDIPDEIKCPYNQSKVESNETQIPISGGCLAGGKAKVIEFGNINTIEEMKTAIRLNKPVVGGFSLTPNFYTSKGIVSVAESGIDGAMDKHAAGHALLVVGIMELPEKIREREGSDCFIVANSWSVGWGVGGHACLTENWIIQHKLVDFLVVQKVQI